MTAASLVLTSLPLYHGPAYAAETAPTVTIQECQNLADPDVRRQIQELTTAALNHELADVDYALLVEKHWRATNMSARLDAQVDEAIAAVRADTDVFDRAYSTISQDTAAKTAVAVSERTFGSEGFKAALGDLAQAIGKDFGARIEGAAGKVAGPVIACVRTSLQSRYGSAIAQVFTKETQENAEISPQTGEVKIGSADLLIENAATVSGIVLIVSRRIIARMITSVGQRIAGLVASRIIATFTGLVGLALILHDVYQATDGVFPLIAERMKSDEAKKLIKDELAKSIGGELRQQVGSIAAETADRIYAFWLEFKQRYATLLSLAEKNETFAAFLKDRKIDQLGRLGQLVTLIQGQEGETGVFRRTADGSLPRALLDLDDSGVAVATALKSVDKALAWSKLAGRKLPKAVEYGLPQAIDPATITESQLDILLSFDDRNTALRVAQLDQAGRDAILALPAQNLKDLARRFSDKELAALAAYQSRLQPMIANRILRAVAEDPRVMKTLASQSIQDAIFSSRDQSAAVNMLLRDSAVLSMSNIGNDFSLVRNGEVDYRIFAERYWTGLIVLFALVSIVLLWLRRLIFGRAPTVVIKTTNGGGKGS